VTLERLIGAAADIGLTVVVMVVRYLYRSGETLDRERLRAAVGRILPGQEEDVLSIAAQEIMAEAHVAAKTETLLRQLNRRFGSVPDAVRRKVSAATVGELDQWLDGIVDSRTLEDLFAESKH